MTTPSSLFQDAVRHHEAGNISTAERLYRKVLDKDPRNADAWYLAGYLAIQRRKLTSALLHLDKAIALRPIFPAALLNRGNVLLELGRADEAAASLRSAAQYGETATESFAGLGIALARLNRPAEAEAAFGSALALAPDHLFARIGLADALRQLGRNAEALPHALLYAQAKSDVDLLKRVAEESVQQHLPATAISALQALVALMPQDGVALGILAKLLNSGGFYAESEAAARRSIAAAPAPASVHSTLGQSLFRRGRLDEAATALAEACRIDPSDTEARHFLSLITGQADSEAQHGYVRNLFDNCADTFEQVLVKDLGYCAPWILGEELASAGALTTPGAIIDLGCGTGLCGKVLKPHAARLDGVDIAPRMIYICRGLGIYDGLEAAELVSYLDARPASYDIAVAGDVLIYVGESTAAFTATRKALRDGGWFAFSVEVSDQAPVRNLSSGRYAHSPQYIHGLAAQTGFSVVSERAITLRQENGQSLPGLAYVLRAR